MLFTSQTSTAVDLHKVMAAMGTVYLKLMSHDHLYNLTPLTITAQTIIITNKIKCQWRVLLQLLPPSQLPA